MLRDYLDFLSPYFGMAGVLIAFVVLLATEAKGSRKTFLQSTLIFSALGPAVGALLYLTYGVLFPAAHQRPIPLISLPFAILFFIAASYAYGLSQAFIAGLVGSSLGLCNIYVRGRRVRNVVLSLLIGGIAGLSGGKITDLTQKLLTIQGPYLLFCFIAGSVCSMVVYFVREKADV